MAAPVHFCVMDGVEPFRLLVCIVCVLLAEKLGNNSIHRPMCFNPLGSMYNGRAPSDETKYEDNDDGDDGCLFHNDNSFL